MADASLKWTRFLFVFLDSLFCILTIPLILFLSKALDFFRTGFDRQEAEKEGKIIPRAGVDPQYDESLKLIQEIEADAESYIQEQRKYFGSRVTYVGSDKKRFQLEVPEASAKKADHRYEIQGQRKGFKRYYTAEGREFIRRMMAAEEQRDNALKVIGFFLCLGSV
jgi:DNA mismatch repair protein MSH6